MKEINLSTKITVYPIEECLGIEKKLIDAAKSATKNSYAPYSEFHVGAAVLLGNGEIISGSNQENAAYPSGICAERTAAFFAHSKYPNQNIEAIAIAAWYKGNFTKDVITPCGACRQVLLEAENRFQSPMKVLMCSEDAIYIVNSIKDLLPFSYDDKMLNK